jgi:hypothetical protein
MLQDRLLLVKDSKGIKQILVSWKFIKLYLVCKMLEHKEILIPLPILLLLVVVAEVVMLLRIILEVVVEELVDY